MSKRRENWFDFHFNLMGYNLYKLDKLVPKYIVYWKGISSDSLFSSSSNIKALPKV